MRPYRLLLEVSVRIYERGAAMSLFLLCVVIGIIGYCSAWASESDYRIIPGKSLGTIHIGMSKADLFNVLGKPATEEQGSVVYRSKNNKDYLKIYLSGNKVSQIQFTSPAFRTVEGMTTHNYGMDRYDGKFDKYLLRWRFANIKYVLKDGGLSFYTLNADSVNDDYPVISIGAVYAGKTPVREIFDIDDTRSGWRLWDGGDTYNR